MKRIISVLLAVLLLCSAVIPVFAAETIYKPKLVVNVKAEQSVYGPYDDMTFTVTVTNIGRVDAEHVYISTKSHKHIDVQDDQQYVVIGDLAAGESAEVVLYANYKDINNSTLMTRLFLNTIIPMQEFYFTIYAEILAPILLKSFSYCEVNVYDAQAELDKNYGVLVQAKYGDLPGEVETPTEAPATEPEQDEFEEITTESEVTDGFVEAPSDYPFVA